MQEEIDHKSITFVVNVSKVTSRFLLKIIQKYLADRQQNNNSKIPHGKQTMKQLVKQNQGLTNIEITDENIKSFEKVAKKYGVDFALKKDDSAIPCKYLVFFKGRDEDAITAAFTEYSANKIKQASKPSVLNELKEQKQNIENPVIDKVKNKSKEQLR